MRNQIRLIVLLFCFLTIGTAAQAYNISGKVIDKATGKPVEYALISLNQGELWTLANGNGEFVLRNVQPGKLVATVRCLGFVKGEFYVTVADNMYDVVFALQADNLSIDEVVVTARKNDDNPSTSYTVDRTVLDHMQVLNVADVASLLPGGRTSTDIHLATSGTQPFTLRRTTTSETGHSTFGTAVEVDGVRLGANSIIITSAETQLKGADLKSVGTSNIESVEIVTGIPSAEYGDLSNGLVKINTRKGYTPYIFDIAIKPNTQLFSVSKGFGLGVRGGTLNTSVEHTKSISNIASPYTSYVRNNISATYSNTFNRNRTPLSVTASVTGNIGGYDSQADPDSKDLSFVTVEDNAVRASLRFDWLVRKPWITNIEASFSGSYADKKQTKYNLKSSAAAVAALHTTAEGYYVMTGYDSDPSAPIISIMPGYWDEYEYTDSKPVNYSAKLKAGLKRKFGSVDNRTIIGGEFSGNGNMGRGIYYEDIRYAPTWRAMPYYDLPFMNTLALYAEETIDIPIGPTRLNLMAGARHETTVIAGSEYGVVNTLSPRFNAGYTIIDKPAAPVLKRLSFHGGWGKAYKLPSFTVLYPTPTYIDKRVFSPGSLADGSAFDVYYTQPSALIYNSDLRWQHSRQTEIGLKARIAFANVSLTLFRNKTVDPYVKTYDYTPFAYKFTNASDLDNSPIAYEDRVFAVDSATGIVTVSDRSGVHAPQELSYKEQLTYKSATTYVNGSPITRQGVDWIVDFDRIRSLRTSIRLDGSYYNYRSAEQVLVKSVSSFTMNNGDPYRYVGYYAGGASYYNGSESRTLTTNMTVTTHIPAVRLIVSVRVEGTLMNVSQKLSEWDGGQRSYVVEDRSDSQPAASNPSIYKGNVNTITYPVYYATYDSPGVLRDFATDFMWARDNDPALYEELAKMIVRTNSDYWMNENSLSSYFSANFSVTKEIGDKVSISFNANNFFNNMGDVISSNTNQTSSLYNTTYIPKFYFGMSLRIKL